MTIKTKRVRFAERPGLPWYKRILGSLNSCTAQVFLALIVIGFLVWAFTAYVLREKERAESNPDGVGGKACKVSDLEKTTFTLADGTTLGGWQMDKGKRMSKGDLLLYEDEDQNFEIALPPGRYQFALRVQGSRTNGGLFRVIFNTDTPELAQTFTLGITQKRWYARQRQFEVPVPTQFDVEIELPGEMRWCLEVARLGDIALETPPS